MESSQDKSLPATERKLQKTRKDGQTSRSRDLGHLTVLGVGSLVVMMGGPTLMQHLRIAMGQQLSFDAATVLAPQLMVERLLDMSLVGLVGCVIFALVINAASIITTLMSGGWIYSLKPITPQFKRINPISGLGNVFSKQQMVTALKNVVLMLILSAVGWFHIQTGIVDLSTLPALGGPAALAQVGDWIITGMLFLLVVVFAVAMIDVPLQKFLFLQRLKMSHQEVKQEHKESEGSPELKGRIRQKQREIAQRASIGAVPKADFVVTNPTHYSVALRYDEATMAAPQVIAMGADLIALKIREIAKAHDVPVLESPMLARALYAHAEIDQAIPSTLYTAVAQVLAYVYRLKAAQRGQGPAPGELVQPQVPPELDPHAQRAASQ
ncbi:MAG: flagellar biosynthesis protein FlhB [Comamonas sp.]